MEIKLAKVPQPKPDHSRKPILLSEETMKGRLAKILQRMKQQQIDTLVIYGDLEHGSNLEYLIGFVPRFEEAVLVLHQDATAYLLLGNENLNKAKFARIAVQAVHVPVFSLPNQPMVQEKNLADLFQACGIIREKTIGIVGWKLFTSNLYENQHLFDIPYYVLEAIQKVADHQGLRNATALFISPEDGARITNTANELAHYEFGASLAADCMLETLNQVVVGSDEMTLASHLHGLGQRHSVVTIAGVGERFEQANLYPKDKLVQVGEKLALTVGYKGGLSSRAGYCVEHEEQLPVNVRDYLDVICKPYFGAIATWLEEIHCGMTGGELYARIEKVLPKEQYHWSLCPGHLVADEEWLCSPIYEGSSAILKSGMLLQTDIIPHIQGYGGVSVESTVALADQSLKQEIQDQYPALWQRMEQRRTYVCEILGIKLHEDVLLLGSTAGYLRPFMLAHDKALVVKKA